MKKLSVLLAVLLSAVSAQAQITERQDKIIVLSNAADAFKVTGTSTLPIIVITPGAQPGGTLDGTFYYDSAAHRLKYYNGNTAAWTNVGSTNLTSSDFANQGTTTTLLHGNAVGNLSFGSVVNADLNLAAVTCTNQFIRSLTATLGNTCATVQNADLANSSVTISGHVLSLGGTLSLVNSDVGLGNVTNDTQTKAAVVPNTAPTAGQILVGNAGGTAYAPVTVSGSGATITASSAGVFTISAIANASLSNSSVTYNGKTVSLGGSATLSLASADFANQGTTTTVLHGNAAGNPSFAAVANADLANSAITIAGTSTSLGGSITQDTITGLASTGIVKRTAVNTLGIAVAGTDFVGVGGALFTLNAGASVGLTAPGAITQGSTVTIGATTDVVQFARYGSGAAADATANYLGEKDGIGAVSTDSVVLKNATAAAAGAQQWSPRFRLTGQGWKTNAVAASQVVDWIDEIQPVQDAAAPINELVWSQQVNGGGFKKLMKFSSGSAGLTGAHWSTPYVEFADTTGAIGSGPLLAALNDGNLGQLAIFGSVKNVWSGLAVNSGNPASFAFVTGSSDAQLGTTSTSYNALYTDYAGVNAGAWTIRTKVGTATNAQSHLPLYIFPGQGSGSNIAGQNFTLAGGQSTGTGAGGSIIFQTSPAGTTGSSLNALTTVGQVTSTGAWALTGSLGVSGNANGSGAGAYTWFTGNVAYYFGYNFSGSVVYDTVIGGGATTANALNIGGAGGSGTKAIFGTGLPVTIGNKIANYNNINTAGLGVPAIYSAPAISATQTANFTVATYTPPAAAGQYEAQCVVTTTSATNTGTVQVTLDYTDSQGTVHTGDVIPLQDAAGAWATTKSGASKEFYSAVKMFSINNAAANIVPKVVITGSVSYTVGCSIIQVQ